MALSPLKEVGALKQMALPLAQQYDTKPGKVHLLWFITYAMSYVSSISQYFKVEDVK